MLLYTEPLTETDREYVEHLWSEYRSLMYSAASRYTCDKNLQQDIIQGSIEVIIKNISTIRTLECCILARYLVLIVRSTSINYLKRAGIEYNLFTDDETGAISDIPDDTESIEDQLLHWENRENINAILSRLSESDRMLLEGKYLLQQPDAELADILGVSTASIRMKLTRARRRAEKLFRSKGYDHAL